MRTFGLIGKTLSHSFSKPFFEQKFKKENIQNAQYQNFELGHIEDFESLKQKKIDGCNVTIPYKESIIPFLDELSEEAKQIRAVNTIKHEKGKWKGHNTDVYGFRESLKYLLDIIPQKALILGTGGASKAVRYVLEQMQIQVHYVSRNKKEKNRMTYQEVSEEIITQHKLIINTTPLGMYPNTESFPELPYHALTETHCVFDLIYNPKETLFLKKAKAQGAKIKNGLEMLKLQALKSWEIWNS